MSDGAMYIMNGNIPSTKRETKTTLFLRKELKLCDDCMEICHIAINNPESNLLDNSTIKRTFSDAFDRRLEIEQCLRECR